MIIIGLSGTNLSGKGTVREIIEKRFKTYSTSLSDVLREDLKEKEIEPTRDALIAYGNELRKNEGSDILARRTSEKLEKQAQAQDFDIALFDSVRNIREIEFLKKKYRGRFKLLFVDATVEIRYKRSIARARAGEHQISFDQFKKIDDIESGKTEEAHVQQLVKCGQVADIVIINEGTFEKLEEKVVSVLKEYLK
jgi:dephospho-CoA kinase